MRIAVEGIRPELLVLVEVHELDGSSIQIEVNGCRYSIPESFYCDNAPVMKVDGNIVQIQYKVGKGY